MPYSMCLYLMTPKSWFVLCMNFVRDHLYLLYLIRKGKDSKQKGKSIKDLSFPVRSNIDRSGPDQLLSFTFFYLFTRIIADADSNFSIPSQPVGELPLSVEQRYKCVRNPSVHLSSTQRNYNIHANRTAALQTSACPHLCFDLTFVSQPLFQHLIRSIPMVRCPAKNMVVCIFQKKSDLISSLSHKPLSAELFKKYLQRVPHHLRKTMRYHAPTIFFSFI